MNHLRNPFGWNAQKNIDNAQLNKVEKEVDGFVIIDNIDNQISIPEQRYPSKALNIRNVSNNIVSGIKKITSGILDIVNYANPFYKAPANNKTPQQKTGMRSDNKTDVHPFNKVPVNNKTSQQKAGMLSDTESIQKLTKASMLSDAESIQKLTKKIKLNYKIGVSYLKSKKGNKFAEEITKLKEKNENLLKENEKLKNSKSPLDTFKKFANLCLISKNNAKILHNYICLACAKASSDDGSDKQQILFQANGVAEKMAKKYENHAKNIFGKISNLENLLKKTKNPEKKHNELKTKLELNQNANKGNLNKKNSGKQDAMLKRPGVRNISTPKLPKEIVDNNDKPHALKNYINFKPFKNESIEESSTLSDTDIDSIKDGYNKAKAKNDEQNKLINEQKRELSKVRKEHGRINKIFAQYGQNDVSNKEIDKELEELERELEKSEK